jgi:Lrp/AsnC family transcriptional regulator, leucine-responsive regulatory protein
MIDKEIELITALRKNSRTSLVNIGQKLNMPVSTLYDKLKRFQDFGIIKRHTTILNFSKLGYYHHMKLALKTTPEMRESLVNFLRENSAINSIHEINSGFDLMLEVIHKNVRDYYTFINLLNEKFSPMEILEFQIIQELERETFLTK